MHCGISHVQTAARNTLYQEETGDGLCHSFISDGMADCTVEMHCMTGYDAISGFCGNGKQSAYDQVVKSQMAQWLLSNSSDSLNLKWEVLDKVFHFTHHVINGDEKSSTMAEGCV